MNESLQPSAQPLTFSVTIPGEPIAQGRPRGFYKPGLGVRMYDPAKSRSWKGAAQVHYREALERAGLQAPVFPDGAVELHVFAVFTCPVSKHRKRDPVGRCPHTGNKDADNIGKACADAANGILWADDRQVARLVVEKVVGAQGEAPRVELTVLPYQRAALAQAPIFGGGAQCLTWPPGCPPPIE